MKRYGNLYPQIIDFNNIYLAARKARNVSILLTLCNNSKQDACTTWNLMILERLQSFLTDNNRATIASKMLALPGI